MYVPCVPSSFQPCSRSLLRVAAPSTVPAAALAVAASVALLAPMALATPAHAEGEDNDSPPAHMSVVGGKRLGSPGTQVSVDSGDSGKPAEKAEPGGGRKGKSGGRAPEVPGGVTSRSWIVTDAESGDVLAAHNAHWRLPPASTLKMLFADTVLPKLPKDKTHKVVHSDLEGMGEGSSLVGVKEGQSYSVRDLWRGVFLRSGNDAVHVLAALNGGVPKTVKEMNARAKKLRADDTHVVTPDGYDEPGQLSSAYDLTLFARSGMQNAEFRDYASTARTTFPGEKKKGKKRGSFDIQNTNRLLTGDIGLKPYPGIAGVKNGSTTNAGFTFTGVAQHGDRVLLVTCMHPDKQDGMLQVYKEAAKLFDWGFSAEGKVKPVGHLAAPQSGEPASSHAGHGKNADHSGGSAAHGKQAQAAEQGSGGAGVALGIAGGCVLLLGAVAYVVLRRWPRRG
jgi:D-alanyl-D-alanine carboxypeptidase (penicillin-binding protein 5/6)